MIARALRAVRGTERRRGGRRAGLLALVVLVGLGLPAGAPAGEATSSAPQSKRTPLYRIVGCRSFGRAPYRAGPPRREAAVGFDDGPWYETPKFVTMLERAGVRATFFMIGKQISAADRSLLLRELRNGDVLGDHTWSHPDLTAVSDVREQLARPIQEIRSLTGYSPCVFRPPYGDYDANVLSIARSLGLATVLWNVDPTDWALPGVAAIEQRVLAQVRPGSIIISHDGGGPRAQTLAAYPDIFATLRARGYRIVTIPQLLGFRPVYERCTDGCDGLGVPRTRVPADAILRGDEGASLRSPLLRCGLRSAARSRGATTGKPCLDSSRSVHAPRERQRTRP